MLTMIDRLDNGTKLEKPLKIGQVNCHDKSDIIDTTFEMNIDILLVQELKNWLQNKKT